MRIRFTIDITRSPKTGPGVEAPDIYDLTGAQVETAAERMPAGFMGTAPQDPWDKK